MGGGMVQHQATDMEIQCLPGDIPDFIEVDMAAVELGQIVHLSDITLPAGVESTALALGDDHDLAIASVIAPRGSKTEDEDDADNTEAEGEEPAAEE
jgi:large subunit ribosomal protein L25